jgi:hypothetical protein
LLLLWLWLWLWPWLWMWAQLIGQVSWLGEQLKMARVVGFAAEWTGWLVGVQLNGQVGCVC